MSFCNGWNKSFDYRITKDINDSQTTPEKNQSIIEGLFTQMPTGLRQQRKNRHFVKARAHLWKPSQNKPNCRSRQWSWRGGPPSRRPQGGINTSLETFCQNHMRGHAGRMTRFWGPAGAWTRTDRWVHELRRQSCFSRRRPAHNMMSLLRFWADLTFSIAATTCTCFYKDSS